MQILSSLKNGLYAFTVAAATLLPRAATAYNASICITEPPSVELTNGIGNPVAYRLHQMAPASLWNPYALANVDPATYPNDPPLGSILFSVPQRTWTADPSQVSIDSTNGALCFPITTDTLGLNNSIVSILYQSAQGSPSVALITTRGLTLYHGREDVVVIWDKSNRPPFYQAPIMRQIKVNAL